jgi:cytidylate kinase
MIYRDEYDSSRLVSPLRPAEDALILDTDRLNEQQVFQEVLELIHRMGELDRL